MQYLEFVRDKFTVNDFTLVFAIAFLKSNECRTGDRARNHQDELLRRGFLALRRHVRKHVVATFG